MKWLIKAVFPLFLILCIFTTSMISATWFYSEGYIEDQISGINLGLSVVEYPPAEILPNTAEDTANGVNQAEMMDILSGDVNNGLNSNKGTLEKLVIQDGIVYSDQKVQGGNLKNLFQAASVANLVFVMQYSTNTEIFCYTFGEDDRTSGTPDETKIVVYKTVYRKNSSNRWEGVHAYKGYATVVYVSKISKNSIDVTSWREGEIPKQ